MKNESPETKKKPMLIVVGSTVAMQFAQTMQNDVVVVNADDLK